MERNNEKKTSRSKLVHRFFYPNILLFGCMIALLAFFLVFVYETDRKDVGNLADETIDFIESVCQRYDSYTEGQHAVILKDIFDKAEGLRQFTVTDRLENNDFLLKFAKSQDLSGILITDGNLNPAGEADVDGKNVCQIWHNFLEEKNKKDILENKKKTFSGTVVVNRNKYHVVIVSRRDKKGIILCYLEVKTPITDIYEVSMEKTLTNNTFHKNPKLVITDGTNIIATNTKELYGKSLVVEAPVTNTGSILWKDGSLIHIQWQGENWYGKRQAYKDYVIYVFYPAREVFSNMLSTVTTMIAIYALLCLLVAVFHSHSDRKHFDEERKQMNTIKAMSQLFIATSVLHLQERTFEGISVPERSQRILDETTDGDRVAGLLAERIITPEHQEAYREFLNFDTVVERLEGKEYLTDMFLDVAHVWFATYLIPMEYDAEGRPTEILFLSRNINDYKQKEELYKEELRKIAREAELASDAKTSFLQRMSHDIRTPLNGIKGMASIAGNSLDTPERAKECIDKIIVSADYLYALLDDILRMSKLESGEILFEEKAFDIRKVIEDTCAFITERAREKRVQFSYDLSELVHTHVIGSPLHFRQVIQNVMSNAVKFNRTGGRIKVSCRELSEVDGDIVYEFVCADTGIGISQEFQDRIFDLFAQEGDSARTNYEGSGLGLPIAKELLEKRGGTIKFTSEKGVGSTFTITIPLKPDPVFRKKDEEAVDFLKPASIEGVRILLVEDNEINMEIAKCLLEEEKAVITEAHDGREAVRIFEESEVNAFNIILMDIMMPELNGLEATKVIRSMDRADAAEIPIFAMTANAFAEDIKASQEAGMNEHFAKPLDMKEMVKTIYRYCRKKRYKKKGEKMISEGRETVL